MNPVGETEDYMESQNIENSKHENLRRAIEVPSIAIKNLKSSGIDMKDVKEPLLDLIKKSAEKLKGLISN